MITAEPDLTLLSLDELKSEMARLPGLIPVGVDSSSGQLRWLDLASYHCYQGFFRDALAFYRALSTSEPAEMCSRLDVLAVPDLIPDTIAPTGFIFHAGRCGSTLLARVLARSRSNMVFSEASAHNQMWRLISAQDTLDLALYRSLLTGMGRQRLPSYRHHIIKLTSWNIVQSAFIQTAFPDAPALFLFREPGRLLESYGREQAPWMGIDTGIGLVWNTPEAAIEAFFEAAIARSGPRFRVLDYADLTPERLPLILQYLCVEVSPAELRQMTSEFLFDAKSAQPRPFQARPTRGDFPPSPSLVRLYEILLRQARLDWADTSGASGPA